MGREHVTHKRDFLAHSMCSVNVNWNHYRCYYRICLFIFLWDDDFKVVNTVIAHFIHSYHWFCDKSKGQLNRAVSVAPVKWSGPGRWWGGKLIVNWQERCRTELPRVDQRMLWSAGTRATSDSPQPSGGCTAQPVSSVTLELLEWAPKREH